MSQVAWLFLAALCACHAPAAHSVLDVSTECKTAAKVGCTFDSESWSAIGKLDRHGNFEMHVLQSGNVNKYSYKETWGGHVEGWVLIETLNNGEIESTSYHLHGGTCSVLTVDTLPAGLEHRWKHCVPSTFILGDGRYSGTLPETYKGISSDVPWNFDLNSNLAGCFPQTDVVTYGSYDLTLTYTSVTLSAPADDVFPCPQPPSVQGDAEN